MSNVQAIKHGPFAVMAGAPWNVLDSRGARIALCGGDSNDDWERCGPPIAAAIVEALNQASSDDRGPVTGANMTTPDDGLTRLLNESERDELTRLRQEIKIPHPARDFVNEANQLLESKNARIAALETELAQARAEVAASRARYRDETWDDSDGLDRLERLCVEPANRTLTNWAADEIIELRQRAQSAESERDRMKAALRNIKSAFASDDSQLAVFIDAALAPQAEKPQ